MVRKCMVSIFRDSTQQYGSNVTFVQSGIYQLKSAMRKTVFLYSKTGFASVWLDRKSYSSTFYLVALREEIDFGRKYGEQKNAYWSTKKSWYAE